MAVVLQAPGSANLASGSPVRQRRFGGIARLYPEKWHALTKRQGWNRGPALPQSASRSVRGLFKNRRPFGDFAVHQRGQRLRAPFLRLRDDAAKIEQAFADIFV